MQKQLAVVGLVCALAGSIQAEAAAQNGTALPVSPRPYQYVAELQVNTHNQARHVVAVTGVDGRSQIARLLEETRYEEQWAFLPDLELWIEVGTNEQASQDGSEVEIDVAFVRQLAAAFGTVELVHFHPSVFFGANPGESKFKHAALSDIDGQNIESIGLALPSPADVEVSLKLSMELAKSAPDAALSFVVVSPHGTVRYGPTTRGIKRMLFEAGNPRADIAHNILVRSTLMRSARNVRHVAAGLQQAKAGELITVLCDQLSDAHYEMHFHSR